MQQIQDLEARIDIALQNAGEGDACVVDVDNTFPVAAFDTVVNDYRALGWNVAVQTDFRGNRQITLTAPV